MYLCHVVLKTIIFPTIPRNLSKIELPGKELELFKISGLTEFMVKNSKFENCSYRDFRILP